MPQFTPEKFERMIDRRGRPVRWERAAPCPCLDPMRFSPKEGCPLCSSIGHVWTVMETFTATVLSITAHSKYTRFGDFTMGDSVMTFAAGHHVGKMDRITLMDGEDRLSDVLLRATRDTLPSTEILSIVQIRDENRFYAEGLDFERHGQEIVWVGQQPAAGQGYSVLYTARPQFVAWLDLTQQRVKVRRTTVGGAAISKEMPRKVTLRKWLDFLRPANA